MKFFMIVLQLLFIAIWIEAQIIRIPQDFNEIQLAINAAQDGDTIIVSRGRYYENIDFLGKGIVLASNFIVSGNVEDIDSTIIDGSQPNNPDTASCVLMYKLNQSFANDTSAALIGFTLTGGEGTVWEDEHGGGNFYREGGGILIQYWAPRILFNVIKFNNAYNKTGIVSAGGGAIRCGDGNPLISNNIITNNRARYGAGIVLNYSGAVIRNNIIAYNYGGEDYAGSGIWILGNRFDNKIKIIENNTIVKNASVLSGGGIYLWSATGNFIRNNIIWNNTAPSNPQIRSDQSSAQIIYNDVEGGWTGEGNINLNPDFWIFNFYLSSFSPCIDAGKDSVVFNDPEDPANPGYTIWPSRGTIRNDMGAYGGPKRTDLPQIITEVEDDQPVVATFVLEQNYPNPFNPSTKISWQSPVGSWQTLKVYDVLGNEIATLVDEYKPAGKYEVEFQSAVGSRQLASGIYFYQLQAGSLVQTKKMILLK